MNEMYVISVLMLYTLIILINTLLNTYRLLTTTEDWLKKKNLFILNTSIYHRVHTYVAPIDPKN